jgi:hypothetical protein
MSRYACTVLFSCITLSIPLAAAAECMGPYPPSMVKAFNQNCATEPKLVAYCGCIMNEVQKNIPLADFIEIGNSAGGINNDPRFIKSSKKCSAQLPDTPASATPVPATTALPAKQKP